MIPPTVESSESSVPISARISARIRETAKSALIGDGLKTKVLRGGAWLGSGSTIEQAARFGRNMILARLLAPAAFGTMAIALSSASVVDALTDVGIRGAVIQNPRGAEPRYLNTAWWLAVLRGIGMYSTVFALAPWISRFYGNPQLCPLLRVALLSVIFSGATSPGANVMIKEMNFFRWAVITNGGAVCGVVLTVVLSLFVRDVWALAIGYCSENVARFILSYILCPYLPSLPWDREAARDLLRFSRGQFGLSLLNLVFARADVFVLAKLYSPAALGLYTMAISLVQTPANFVMNMLGQTLLPALSKIQGDTGRTNQILIRVTSMIALLGLPVLTFILFCAPSVLTVVYGSRYAIGAVPLILASCVALLNIENGQLTIVFYAQGLPHLHRRCVIIMALVVSGLIYPLSKWLGLAGGQLACAIAIVAGYTFQVVRTSRLTNLRLFEYVKSFPLGLAISTAVVAVCLVVQPFAVLTRPVPKVIFGILGCVLSYSILSIALLRSNGKVSART